MFESEYTTVTSVEDLPDHPTGRAYPGYNPYARQFLSGAIERIGKYSSHGDIREFIVVASTTVQIYAENYGVAARDACEKFPDGDLTSATVSKPVEVGEVDEDRLLKNWYYENRKPTENDDYPLFEVELVGAGRFFMWARDSAQVSEVGPGIVDAGDYDLSVYLNDWSVEPDSVDLHHLAVSRTALADMLEEAIEDGDST